MCLCVCTCVCVCVCVYMCMYVCMCACICVMYVCIYVCVYVCMPVCMYNILSGCALQVHVYTEEKPLNAVPLDGYFRRCQVVEAEPPVDGATVCSFACGGNERGCDYVFVRVFGRYGPVRSLCEVELIGN